MSDKILNTSAFGQVSPSCSQLSFAQTKTTSAAKYTLELNESKTLKFDEISIEPGANGELNAALYASGTFIRRHENFMLVRAANHSLWMGDRFGGWHPID